MVDVVALGSTSGCSINAMPKSSSLTKPDLVTMIFAGLMSR